MWKNSKCAKSKNKYTEYRKILARVIKDAKEKYEGNTINENSNNSKKLWEIINEKIGKSKKKNENTINVIIDDGKKIENKAKIANCMNGYFCKVDKKLSEQLGMYSGKSKLITLHPKSIFYINPTNTQEAGKILKELKDKSGGNDKINARNRRTRSKQEQGPPQ